MADFKFNLWDSIIARDLDGVGNNLFMYTVLSAMLAAIPFLVFGRYVSGKTRQLTTDKIDICEQCIGKFMNPSLWPSHKKEGLEPTLKGRRNYVMSHCKICSKSKFTFNDACTGGPQRCQRLSTAEYIVWSKK